MVAKMEAFCALSEEDLRERTTAKPEGVVRVISPVARAVAAVLEKNAQTMTPEQLEGKLESTPLFATKLHILRDTANEQGADTEELNQLIETIDRVIASTAQSEDIPPEDAAILKKLERCFTEPEASSIERRQQIRAKAALRRALGQRQELLAKAREQNKNILIAGERKEGPFKIILTTSGKILFIFLEKKGGGSFKILRAAYDLTSVDLNPIHPTKLAYLTGALRFNQGGLAEHELDVCGRVNQLSDLTGLLETFGAQLEIGRPEASEEKQVRFKLLQPWCEGDVTHLYPARMAEMVARGDERARTIAILDMMLELVAGLQHLHNGTGHYNGDMKTDNILIDSNGDLHITDMGLAAPIGPYSFNGTPEFWPPSILRASGWGQEISNQDALQRLRQARTKLANSRYGQGSNIDLHGLGRIFYFLMAGKHPHFHNSFLYEGRMGNIAPSMTVEQFTQGFDSWYESSKTHPNELVRIMAMMVSDQARQVDPQFYNPPLNYLESWLKDMRARTERNEFLLPKPEEMPW